MATQTVTATVGYHLEVERGGAAVWCPGTVGDKRRPHDHQAVKITDIRPNQSDFTLDTQGFEVRPFHTSATNFDDVDAIREYYYPDVCAHVKKVYVLNVTHRLELRLTRSLVLEQAECYLSCILPGEKIGKR